MAAAQGTMNNLNFGNAKYQYYETICSGSPAGPGFPGTDAVHTHMTNTRLTDPEVLEFRFPVRAGGFPHPQGLGRARQMERRRRHPPHHPLPREDGLHDPVRPPPRARRSGSPAASPARSARTGCAARTAAWSGCKGCDATVIDAGEAVIIQTPTAGGYGDPRDA